MTLLTEPEAAAVAYSRARPIEPGELVAVYDFGGGTFDAALIARTDRGFELTGTPEGMERLGGIDFDEAVLAHVDRASNGALSTTDVTDPGTLTSLAQLRVECRRAKEALSVDADTTIPIALPGLRADVHLTRAEFEAMIRPRIAQTIEALTRTIASAAKRPEDVSRVLLVGGSSRIPLVAEMITAATGRPVSVDVHPKLTIASGAALVGAARAVPVTRTAPPTEVVEWRPPERVESSAATPRRRRPPVALIAVGTAVLAAIVVAAIVVLTRSGDDAGSTVTTPAPAAPTEPATAPTEPPSADATTTTTAASTAPSTSADAPTAAAPTVVATLDGSPVTMSGAATGAMIVSTDDGVVLAVTDDGTARSVAAVPDGIGEYGGITATPDGRYLATTPQGVIDLMTGGLVVDGAAAGLGSTPGPVATDGLGNVYVADNDAARILRQGTDGTLSLVAGNGSAPAGGDDGKPAFTVGIGTVRTMVIDTSGRLVFFEAGAERARLVDGGGAIQPADHVPALPGGATTFAVDSLGRLWLASNQQVSVLAAG